MNSRGVSVCKCVCVSVCEGARQTHALTHSLHCETEGSELNSTERRVESGVGE
jgi:hypothetical protein